MKRILLILFILFAGVESIYAKTGKFGTWIEIDFTKKFLKDFELSFLPELRLQDNLSVDEYIVEGKLGYNPVKFLDLAFAYRIKTNVKKSGNEVTYSPVFDITGKQEINRFKAALRTRFTNDPDFGDTNNSYYFRPRAKLAYNIKGVKAEPFVSTELFFGFNGKGFLKARHDIGFSHRITQKHEFGIYYRLNDYFSEKSSINILGIDYKLKL